MKLLVLIFLMLSLNVFIKCDDYLQSCYEKLKSLNIKPKPMTYSQLINESTTYLQSYCRISSKQPLPLACVSRSFMPSTDLCGVILARVTVAAPRLNLSVAVNFVINATSTPGVFAINEQVSGADRRLLAIMEAQPGFMIYYLCSETGFHFDDIMMNTNLQNLEGNNLQNKLKPYAAAFNCTHFQTRETDCPTRAIPLTKNTLTRIVDFVQGIVLRFFTNSEPR